MKKNKKERPTIGEFECFPMGTMTAYQFMYIQFVVAGRTHEQAVEMSSELSRKMYDMVYPDAETLDAETS